MNSDAAELERDLASSIAPKLAPVGGTVGGTAGTRQPVLRSQSATSSLDHMASALHALDASYRELVKLGDELIGPSGDAKVPARAYEKSGGPVFKAVHLAAMDIENMAASIKAEIARIRAGI